MTAIVATTASHNHRVSNLSQEGQKCRISAKFDAHMVALLSLRSSKVCRKTPNDDSPQTWLTGDESGMLEARDMRLTSITWHETRMLPSDRDEVVFHLRKNLNPGSPCLPEEMQVVFCHVDLNAD